MKSKRKEVKKYNVGGYLQAGLGTAQTLYGLSQIPAAKAEFERAQAAAPSLETPSQYYENYKNAYDSEIARMENDAIQSNLASSLQALQGAGGRALVGGLGSANQLANRQQQQMLGRERNIRLQAGQQLAAAEAATIGRKETRSQSEIAMANKGYQAALGNVGSGIGSIGTGLMYGMRGDSNPFKAAVDSEKFVGMDELNEYLNTRNDAAVVPPPPADTQSVTSNSDLAAEATKNTTNEMLEQAMAEDRLNRYRTRNATGFNMADYPVNPLYTPQGRMSPNYSMFEDRLNNYDYIGSADKIDISKLEEVDGKSYQFAGGQIYQVEDSKTRAFEKDWAAQASMIRKSYIDSNPFVSWLGTAYDNVDAYLNNASRREQERQAALRRNGSFKSGGMMTGGEFNHETNPIDIMQDGVKVGEATGNEVILNPQQAASIAKESSFARKLFKRFAKNAKKNK